MAIWLATTTNLNPHTVTVVSMLFRTVLTLTPWLWETVAQERGLRWKQLSLPNGHTRTNLHTDTQVQQCCVTWDRSLKKGCLESRRESWYSRWDQSWVSRVGSASESCSPGVLTHSVLQDTLQYKLFYRHRLLSTRDICRHLKGVVWADTLISCREIIN